jgi:hypothetical protein
VYGIDEYPPLPAKNVSSVVNLETIYINWDKPIDPCPLRTKITFYDIYDNLIEYFIVNNNSFSKKIYNDGYVFVQTMDEAGNLATPIKVDFTTNELSTIQLYIAPNPVSIGDKEFTVFYLLTKPSDYVNIDIYNVSGQLVWSRRLSYHPSGEHSLKVSNFSAGIYFAVLKTQCSVKTNKFSIIR